MWEKFTISAWKEAQAELFGGPADGQKVWVVYGCPRIEIPSASGRPHLYARRPGSDIRYDYKGQQR